MQYHCPFLVKIDSLLTQVGSPCPCGQAEEASDTLYCHMLQHHLEQVTAVTSIPYIPAITEYLMSIAYWYTFHTMRELYFMLSDLYMAHVRAWDSQGMMDTVPERPTQPTSSPLFRWRPQSTMILELSCSARASEHPLTSPALMFFSTSAWTSGSQLTRWPSRVSQMVTSSFAHSRKLDALSRSNVLTIVVALPRSQQWPLIPTISYLSSIRAGISKGQSCKVLSGERCRWEPSRWRVEISRRIH